MTCMLVHFHPWLHKRSHMYISLIRKHNIIVQYIKLPFTVRLLFSLSSQFHLDIGRL
jgi:hypothetical protein